MFQAVKLQVTNFFSSVDNERGTARPRLRKRSYQLDTDNIDTPHKRTKLCEHQSRSSYSSTFFEHLNLKSFYQYVVSGKKKVDANSLTEFPIAPLGMSAESHSHPRKVLTATRQKRHVRVPLSQISNATILDLTKDDDDDDDSDSIIVTKVVTDLTKTSKSKAYNLRGKVGTLERGKSTSFLDGSVRLDERRRYKELLAQFTTISLPEYSESISPTHNRTVKKTPITVDLGKSSPLINNVKTQRILIDLTKNGEQLSPRRKFYNELLRPSKSASSILRQSQLVSRNDFPKMNLNQIDNSKEIDNYSLLQTNSRLSPRESVLFRSDWIKKWRDTLDPLQLERERQIQEEERKKSALKKKQKEDFEKLQEELTNEFPELSEEMLVTVKQALSSHRDIVVRGFNAEISGADLSSLREATWLNDEVVNFYFNLLKERSETDTNFLKVHVFNTFFYPKIVKTGHSGVKRWTRKIDIFSFDLILVPVHLGMHWCLAVVDFKNKQIAYYDSLKGNNMQCIDVLKKYLQDESLDKKKTHFDFDGWSEIIPKDIPEQLNGCDCGVFMCKYAEYKSRNVAFTFKQAHMSYFRKRMIYEIVSKKLL